MDKKPNEIRINLILHDHIRSTVLTLTQQIMHLITGQPS